MDTKLTICIASHADNEECFETVKSIYATAMAALCEFKLRILIVDDASPVPVEKTIPQMERYAHVSIMRNSRRIGCGPSRYVGAMLADGEWLLFVDSHMRFMPGWWEAWLNHGGSDSKALYCGCCLAFDSNTPLEAAKPHFGATWNFYGTDRQKPKQMQVFECVWQPEQPGQICYEIAAPMGASYFIHRDRFIWLNALRNLKSWGGDEQELALKVWLSGGSVRMIKQVRIAHKFKISRLNKVAPSDPIRNKLFVMATCLPERYFLALSKRMHRDGHTTQAMRRLHDEWHLVETERAYNSRIFTVSFEAYLKRFELTCPSGL